jgi:transcriptional regulator NrdR family protein
LAVTETRQTAKVIYRNRKCIACKWIFTTQEEIVENVVIPNTIRRMPLKKKVPEEA